jgi:uncharacterized protein HemY
VLRAQVDADRATLAAAQNTLQNDREQVHEALRQDPFDATALRAAMARTRTDRQNYDQVLQNLFAQAASKMSRDGRLALANWPARRKSASQAR